jgi:hypothetical protein
MRIVRNYFIESPYPWLKLSIFRRTNLCTDGHTSRVWPGGTKRFKPLYLRKALSLAKTLDHPKLLAVCYGQFGSFYTNDIYKPDSAIYYFDWPCRYKDKPMQLMINGTITWAVVNVLQAGMDEKVKPMSWKLCVSPKPGKSGWIMALSCTG